MPLCVRESAYEKERRTIAEDKGIQLRFQRPEGSTRQTDNQLLNFCHLHSYSNLNRKPMKPKILIIDDDTSLRRVLEYNLLEAGYAVAAAASGEDGLRLFAEVSPSLVITDMNMPGMSGMAVLKSIKERSPETLVIIITAFGSVDIAVEAMKAAPMTISPSRSTATSCG